jgi:hypothetical protein
VWAGWVSGVSHDPDDIFNNYAVFQNIMTHSHETGTVLSLFEEHEHLPWPAQSPDLNITESLLSVFETRVRNRFPPPTSLKQLEDVLQEEWYKIPLETVQNSYELIPGRAVVVLKATDGSGPY